MPKKGPGRCDRRGISWIELFELFPDEEAAERWWIASRWPNGVACPSCGSLDIQTRRTKKPQPYRCRSCRYDFSPKTGSLMQGSPLPYRTWVIAIYILTTGIKGTSSMKLHRDLKVSQKTAWFLAHRIRETWNKSNRMKPFDGPVEIDETYVGGRVKNMHASRRQLLKSQGVDNKMIVAGVKDRATGKVRATVVERADKKTLIPFVEESTVPGAKTYTDEAVVYHDLPNHESVTHSIGQYVDGQAHTNGVESFWALGVCAVERRRLLVRVGWAATGAGGDDCRARSLRRRTFAARNESSSHALSSVSGRLRRSARRDGCSVVGEQRAKFGPRGP